MTNLEQALLAFGWQGGTIHQVAQELDLHGKGSQLALMPSTEFAKILAEHLKAKEHA